MPRRKIQQRGTFIATLWEYIFEVVLNVFDHICKGSNTVKAADALLATVSQIVSRLLAVYEVTQNF
jgi:hypothetical protein